jgi:hypothetical protein
MARQRRSGVTTHRVQRSLAAMTVNAQRAYAERQAQESELAGGETILQFKSPVRGTVGLIATTGFVNISFPRLMLPAQDRRDSHFDRPHFTYGWEREHGPAAMVLSAYVDRWRTAADDDALVTGARIASMVWTPAAGTTETFPFSALLHMSFHGWAMPDLNDDAEGTS